MCLVLERTARKPTQFNYNKEENAIMKCPICRDVDLKIAERQGVEIDYCPECRGVWLDRGELEKIIERSYSQTNFHGQTESHYNQSGHSRHYEKQHHDDHGYGHDGHHKKKSWLSELFD